METPPRATLTAWRRAGQVAIVGTPLFIAALGLPVCPSALLMRAPCPGCGLSRATLALLRGDVAAATALNPLAVLVCPAFAGIFLFLAARYVSTGRSGAPAWLTATLAILFGLLVVVWAARLFGAFGGPVSV